MNTLKQKVVEILEWSDETPSENVFDKKADQILALFSQSQAEQVEAIEGLRDERRKEIGKELSGVISVDMFQTRRHDLGVYEMIFFQVLSILTK